MDSEGGKISKKKCPRCEKEKYCWDRCYGCPILICLDCYSGKGYKICKDCENNYGKLYGVNFLYANSLKYR